MFSGLYGDLPSAKGEEAKPTDAPWVGKGLVAPSSLATRRATPGSSAPMPPPSVLRVHVVNDEYDPARPNDYEAVRRAREAKRLEAEAVAARQEAMREAEEATRLAVEHGAAAAATTGTPAARAAHLGLSGEEAWLRRGGAPGAATAQRSQPAESRLEDGGGEAPAATGGSGMTLAQRMLEKMGWKEGEGLGRNRQGISTPLAVQKTDARSGVIVNAAPLPSAAPGPAGSDPGTLTPGPPAAATRVVLLKNMVGPGEVDESLEEEAGLECSKFGTVTSVLIFEVTEAGFPAHEAVRIFIQFSTTDAASKALMDLNGRFFGGRVVAATYFDEAKFEVADLAPSVEEIINATAR